MAYTITTPNERIYNLSAETDNLPKSSLLIHKSSNATLVTGNFLGDSGRFFDFEMRGQFTFAPNKSDLNDVSGQFTSFSYSYQGMLVSAETYSEGYNLDKFLVASGYPYSLSLLSGDDVFEGSKLWSKPDLARGLTGNDVFWGHMGDDYFDGGLGTDTMKFSGSKAQYTIQTQVPIENLSIKNTVSNGVIVTDTVPGRNGVDKGIDVERLVFDDLGLAFDLSGYAGNVAKTIAAIFGAAAVTNKNYVGIGLKLSDAGMPYEELAALAASAAGLNTPAKLVSTLWFNLMGSLPSASEAAPFIGALESGMAYGALVKLAAESDFNKKNVDLVGLQTSGLEYLV